MLSKRGFLTLFIAFLLAFPAYSVGTDGTIVGTVTDAKGGVISRAKVTVKNTGTNAVREVFTNAGGEYTAPLLPPGLYEISVEQTGFRRAIISQIKLDVDQTARVDVVLQGASPPKRASV